MSSRTLRGAAALLVIASDRGSRRRSREPTDDEITEEIIVTAQKRATVAAGRAVLGRGASRQRRHRAIRRDQHRRAGAQRAGPLHHRSRPRPEPGRDPRHQRRPGRARPAGREGIGRHLSRRVADLGRAVHAGPRSVRPRSHRSAARPAGHAVRRGLVVGHGALHHRAAQHRRASAVRSDLDARTASPTATSAARVRGAINVPLGETAAMRVVGYYTELPGFIDSVYPGRDDAQGRERRHAHRRAHRIPLRADREPHRSRRASSTRSWRPTAIRASTSTTSSATPTRPREPPVDPGERGQVTQIREGITDEFTLADLKIDFGFGSVGAHLGHLVHRSQRRGGARRQPAHRQRRPSDLGGTTRRRRASTRRCTTPPICRCSARNCASRRTGEGPFQWLVGAFYQQIDRKYGQNLPTPGYDALTRDR